MKTLLFCLSCFLLLSGACGRIKRKAGQLSDRVFPRFDAYTPDTESNRKRFRDFLQVELTPDVYEIYCFQDNLGIDYDYQFSFHCDTATAAKILARQQLARDTTSDYGFGMQNDFDWWDKEQIQGLKLFSHSCGRECFQYFWYDSTAQKAYYFEFTM